MVYKKRKIFERSNLANYFNASRLWPIKNPLLIISHSIITKITPYDNLPNYCDANLAKIFYSEKYCLESDCNKSKVQQLLALFNHGPLMNGP